MQWPKYSGSQPTKPRTERNNDFAAVARALRDYNPVRPAPPMAETTESVAPPPPPKVKVTVDFNGLVAPPQPDQVEGVPESWEMPMVNGLPICELDSKVNRLKRARKFADALALAIQAADAMKEAASKNPACAMPHYVAQVAVLLSRFSRFEDEIELIERWRRLSLPNTNPLIEVSLDKRLARAQEAVAKRAGDDHAVELAQALWSEFNREEAKLKREGGGTWITNGREEWRKVLAAKQFAAPSTVPSLTEFQRGVFLVASVKNAADSGKTANQIALLKVAQGEVLSRFDSLFRSVADTVPNIIPEWPQIVPLIRAFVGDEAVWAADEKTATLLEALFEDQVRSFTEFSERVLQSEEGTPLGLEEATTALLPDSESKFDEAIDYAQGLAAVLIHLHSKAVEFATAPAPPKQA
ncbi:MAG: hypothetical protein Q3962_04535 [Corynebacterium sp.]|nr:hypothetical protein [Corynebacterium sp.]